MVVYLDVLMFENLCINFFLIYITAETLKIYVKLKYIAAAAFVGSLYVLVIVYPVPKIFTSLIFKILVAFIMIFVCFRKSNFLFNLKAVCILILYSMLVAGFCIFMEFENGNVQDLNSLNFSYKYILIAVFISYVLIHRLIVYVKDRKKINNYIYDVYITVNSREKKIKAFLDTGNELKEPATNLPVMIVERGVLKDVNIENEKIFYIPFKGVNGLNGVLKGFKPSAVNIYNNKTYEKKEIIVAISDGKFSELNDYNALLSRGII
ncbi:MAG: sigma-E processing peptidase SpoIIGA [Clostridium sp.]|nr:sigma-E processing peptidase SpoIIGA [Clostridium sp.]